MSCIFCEIIKGNSPAEFLYRDEEVVAFKDKYPSAPVHILIVPTEHIDSARHVTEKHKELLGKMVLKARDLAEEVGIAESGYKMVINTGKGGGQIIPHLHLHLIGGARQ